MKGSDIVYYQSSAPSEITDAYALDFVTPTRDNNQDWTLLAASSDGGWLTVEVTRNLDTQARKCSGSRCMEAAPPLGLKYYTGTSTRSDLTRVYYRTRRTSVSSTTRGLPWMAPASSLPGARLQPSPTTALPTESRARFRSDSRHRQPTTLTPSFGLAQVRFFNPGPADPLAALRVDPAVETFLIQQRNFSIPASPTTYDHQCVSLNASWGGPVPPAPGAAPYAKRHIVAFEFIPDPAAPGPKGHVHHFVLSCSRSAGGGPADMVPIAQMRAMGPPFSLAFPPYFTGTMCVAGAGTRAARAAGEQGTGRRGVGGGAETTVTGFLQRGDLRRTHGKGRLSWRT